jgi:hypothetical protein
MQSARLSLQSSELAPPPLHPQESVAPPLGPTGADSDVAKYTLVLCGIV